MIDGIQISRAVSKHVQSDRILVYQRGSTHYALFANREITDDEAIVAINEYIKAKQEKQNDQQP